MDAMAYDESLMTPQEWMQARMQRARALKENRRYKEAERLWAELVATHPGDTWLYARWGGALLLAGDTEEARTALTRALDLYSENTVARFHRACIDVRDGRSGRLPTLQGLSFDEIGAMCSWAAEDADALTTLLGETGYVTLCRNLQSPESGSADRTVSTSGDEVAVWQERMDAIGGSSWDICEAIRKREWTNAIVLLKETKAHGLKTPSRNAVLIYCYYNIGEKETAKKAIEQLLEHVPSHPAPMMTQALFALDELEYAEAERYLRMALEQRPDDWSVSLYLAAALAGQQKDEGMALFQKVRQAYPTEVENEMRSELEYLRPLRAQSGGSSLLRLKIHEPKP